MKLKEHSKHIPGMVCITALLVTLGIGASGWGVVYAEDDIGSFISKITSSLTLEIKPHISPSKLPPLDVDPRTFKQERQLAPSGGEMGPGGSSGGHYR